MRRCLWRPSTDRVKDSNMLKFTNAVEQRYNLSFANYEQLHSWSTSNMNQFWSLIWNFTGVVPEQFGSTVLDTGNHISETNWFPRASLNYAENLLHCRDDRPAVISYKETGERVELSFAELYRHVAKIAKALKHIGVTKGDRVAGYMPNCLETIVSMLATTSIGAIWSSCSPDFGTNSVLDRFSQVQPKVIFSTSGYYYNGKTINILDRVKIIQASLENLEHTIIVNFTEKIPAPTDWTNTICYDSLLRNYSACKIDFERSEFDHPLFIMFSSGTTGKPKCIVHGAGGTLLQHLKEHQLHVDLKTNDKLLYFTTCGWMMWNWQVSALASGVTLVLYDGSPFYPKPTVLFDIVDAEDVGILGTGAKYIASLEKEGITPKDSHSLSSLKTILSTGSPLSHESFDYVYQSIKLDVCLSSISGGTDIISCFVLGQGCAPVYRGEIQCAGLGMAVEIFSDSGASIVESKGELVCTKPFPSMPIGFWNDKGDKYHHAYFSTFENIWAQGDYGEITSNNGFLIHGRSDAVLNPGGIRIGTAEIYRQVEKVPEVLESLAIGQNWLGDSRIVLFVHLRKDVTLTRTLEQKILKTIRSNTTPRHVPEMIVSVRGLPKTTSGKLVELAVKSIVNGEPIKNINSIANPEVLEYFYGLTEIGKG